MKKAAYKGITITHKIHPAVTVLTWLLMGGTYDQDGYIWGLNDESEYGVISTPEQGAKVLLKTDCSVSVFIRECEQLSEDQITKIIGSIAINTKR